MSSCGEHQVPGGSPSTDEGPSGTHEESGGTVRHVFTRTRTKLERPVVVTELPD